jgi:hypothetical protein
VRRNAVSHPWIRAGRTGEWAFAIEETWTGADGSAEDLARALSTGTEMAWVSWTEEGGSFEYRMDGEVITWLDPAEPWSRFGREPDHFVAWMGEAGLPVDKPRRKSAAPARDPRISVLEMLTLALGIRLGREAASGPLLTVQAHVAATAGPVPFDEDEAWGPSPWNWFGEIFDVYVFALFARGVEPEEVVEAFGSSPADARLLTAQDAAEDPGWPCVRAGRSGEWAFALDSGCADVFESARIAQQLSARTEVVTYEINPALNYFRYYADGVGVTAFEPLIARDRYGTEPDRFLPLMEEVGLRTGYGDDEDFRDPTIALLEMLTRAPGIQLTREEASGPLLTFRPPLSGPAMRAGESQESRVIEFPDDDQA